MEILDHLTRKVRRAADELVALKREKQQLLYELRVLREQTKDYAELSRQNQRFRRDHARLKAKLERLSKKLEKHLSNEIRSAPVLQETLS